MVGMSWAKVNRGVTFTPLLKDTSEIVSCFLSQQVVSFIDRFATIIRTDSCSLFQVAM